MAYNFQPISSSFLQIGGWACTTGMSALFATVMVAISVQVEDPKRLQTLYLSDWPGKYFRSPSSRFCGDFQ